MTNKIIVYFFLIYLVLSNHLLANGSPKVYSSSPDSEEDQLNVNSLQKNLKPLNLSRTSTDTSTISPSSTLDKKNYISSQEPSPVHSKSFHEEQIATHREDSALSIPFDEESKMINIEKERNDYYNTAVELESLKYPSFPTIIEFYTKAANLYHIEAAFILGCLYKGPEGNYNFEEAISWFQKAVDISLNRDNLHYVQAMDGLGWTLLQKGDLKNDDDARKYAINIFKQIKALNERDCRPWVKSKIGLRREDRREKAIEKYKYLF